MLLSWLPHVWEWGSRSQSHKKLCSLFWCLQTLCWPRFSRKVWWREWHEWLSQDKADISNCRTSNAFAKHLELYHPNETRKPETFVFKKCLKSKWPMGLPSPIPSRYPAELQVWVSPASSDKGHNYQRSQGYLLIIRAELSRIFHIQNILNFTFQNSTI